MNYREKLGLLQGFTSVILFSLSFVVAKILLEHISPESLVLLREIVSVIVVVMLFGFTPELKKILKFKTKTKIFLILFSILSGALTPFLFLKGLSMTAATDTILINSMGGIMTGVLATIFLKDKISLEKILGTIFMFAGVIIISTHGFSNGLNISLGYFFIFGSVLSSSSANIFFKKFLVPISTDIVVLSRNFWGIICMLLIFPFFVDLNYEVSAILNDTNLLTIFIAYAIFILLTAQFLWYKSLEKIKASISSTLIFLNPFFGVIFAVLILKEDFTGFHLIGGSLIIIGLIFSIYHRKKHGPLLNHKQTPHWLPHWLHF